MSDLVVGRCADSARHVLYRVVRTPRGIMVQVSDDIEPRTRSTVQQAAARLLRAVTGNDREIPPLPRRKWATTPMDDLTEFSPVCRCQAIIEVTAEQVQAETRAALRAGKTRTVRVPFG